MPQTSAKNVRRSQVHTLHPTHQRGLCSETARGQENPKGSIGPTPRPAAEKEPNRLHPTRARCYSPRRAAAAHSSAAFSSA
jgi:hypothetical protein